jgi:EAL domain-containing protein (putative c-di-GMP-specific phosphodiesterase class I)
LFDQKDLKRADIHEASYWAERLHQVISDRKIILFFQPVKSCRDGSVLHQEALLRIQEPDGSLLKAGVFIPMAQKLGLSVELDKLVISRLKGMVDGGGGEENVRLAVNLSPSTVSDPGFINWLCAELEHTPRLASRLIIELSERGAVDRLDSVRRLAEKAGALGVKISLDHFGRGFSSFGYLSNLKIDYLKVDGSYIHGIDQNKENQFFVQTIAKIAHGLDMKIIAEFVETQQEWEMLQNLEVDGGQGYWLDGLHCED